MPSWFDELWAPEALPRDLALALLVIALAMPRLGLVRVFALASGVVMIVAGTLIVHDPVGLLWAIALVAVLAFRLIAQALRADE